MRRLLLIAAIAGGLAFPPKAALANAVSDWDAIASTTIVTNAGIGRGAAGIWFAYVHLAIYDAVNSIDGGFEPYLASVPAEAGSNEDAAAVAAAHDVLVDYFPTQQSSLDADEATSLVAISDTPNDVAAGVAVGQAAGAALIAARADDGLLANVPYTPGSGPGVWQPTPPAFAPAAVPWMGQMTPFTMSSADQFFPKDGPPKLSSKKWTRDYNETKSLGDVNSTIRTAEQTEIGLFYTEHPPQQYNWFTEGFDTADLKDAKALLDELNS